MAENEKNMTRKEFEEQIIMKAQEDKDFKKSLVDNPKGALGKLGFQLPEEVEVKVIEESAKVLYLVLPANPDELTDEQLDAVAGGFCDKCWGLGNDFCSTLGCRYYGATPK